MDLDTGDDTPIIIVKTLIRQRMKWRRSIGDNTKKRTEPDFPNLHLLFLTHL